MPQQYDAAVALQAPVRLTATVNVAGHCSSSSSNPGTDPAESEPCIDLSAAASTSNSNDKGGSSSSSSQQQARQLDDLLEQYAQHQGGQKEAGVPATAAAADVPGQYTLFMLPLKTAAAAAAGSAAAGQPTSSDSSGSETAANALQLVIGRYSHGWATYSQDPAYQQPQQLIQLATAAAVQALNCCFGLHSSQAAITAAETLSISASGHTQLSFSLLNADPTITDRYTWDFDRFEQQYLSKVVASLAPVTQITSTSQILHHTPARTAGKWSQKHNAYVVRHSQLPSFIDSEWAIESGGGGLAQQTNADAAPNPGNPAPAGQVSSSASSLSHLQAGTAAAAAAGYGDEHSSGLHSADRSAVLEPHVLHFLVYIPAADHRPLLLLGPKGKAQDSNSFWIPSWGGLVVINPHTTSQRGSSNLTDDTRDSSSNNSSSSSRTADCSVNADSSSSSSSWAPPTGLNDQQYTYIAAVVLAQLQALLGVAPSTATLNNSVTDVAVGMSSSKHQRFAVQQLPAGTAGFTAWQVRA